ncbi:hypothetical protein WMF45_15860 [Sorangium sp. So ce448]|uniref:hypothetical protein n=1 Tax=Sorangium sp. So ce448 TaxID=3133314 RepID=UPI003F644814
MNTLRCPPGLRALIATAALVLVACTGESTPAGGAAGKGGGGAGGGGGEGASSEGGHGGQGGAPLDSMECVDECPAESAGITIGCKKRFMFGMNYAWHNFAGDFGGIAAWDKRGVEAEAETHAKNLADIRAHGASVVRWWMLPEIRGESVAFDTSENPTGLGGTTRRDVQKALELAEQADVNLVFCLFSFDNFHPTRIDADVKTVGITPLVKDAKRRAKLIDKVVRPIARAVAQSPHRHRMVAWDVINEPELAMTGASPDDGPRYEPDAQVDPIEHAQMAAFLGEAIRALRAESTALVTIGSASMKWARSWRDTDVDFYTFHINDRVNLYWPYNQSPKDYGITDKPVIMGDFPIAGLATAALPTLLESWYSQGYAGAISWAYSDATAAELETIKAFSDAKGCGVTY